MRGEIFLKTPAKVLKREHETQVKRTVVQYEGRKKNKERR